MAVHRGMDFNLPGSAEADLSDEAPLSLSVKAAPSGLEIYLNEVSLDLDDLKFLLVQAVNQLVDNSNPELLLFADKTVTYKQLYRVLDRVNSAGIENISLQAEVEKP